MQHTPLRNHGRPQDFFPGVGKLGVWERKSSSGVQKWTTGCENNA